MNAPARRTLAPVVRVSGVLRVPGDKSISHRALLFAAVAEGRSRIRGLAPGRDVQTTRRSIERLGIAVADEAHAVVIDGRGFAGLDRPTAVEAIDLDCGNSGTTARLSLGLLAARRGRFRLCGDASLSRRPMRRVTDPLARFGASFEGGATLPLIVEGRELTPADVTTGVASAQVKSALILAALQARGTSRIAEPAPTRDHTERLLSAMGAPLRPDPRDPLTLAVEGGAPRLAPLELDVPGDPSSAAYAVALACLAARSTVTVENVCLNPRRLGFYRALERMGADVGVTLEQELPELVGRLTARSSRLTGIDVGAEDVPDLIDELPLLALVGALADGTTRIGGAAELRHKESDRIAATVALLRAFGAVAEERPDGLVVHGGARLSGTAVDARGDHRIAMTATVAAALARGASELEGAEWVAISYPGFFDDLARVARQ